MRLTSVADCLWLGPWGVFDGWNQLSFLPDRFDPSSSTSSRSDYLISRCWVDIDAIVSRLSALRKEYPKETLDKVYVSTNEDEKWLKELEEKLKEDGWKQVSSTMELELGWEEMGVDNAIGAYWFCSLLSLLPFWLVSFVDPRHWVCFSLAPREWVVLRRGYLLFVPGPRLNFRAIVL